MKAGITTAPQEEEYPIIEAGVTIEWTTSSGPRDLVEIKSMYADEDGNIQLRINETHPDAPDGPRTIGLQDVYDQLNFREYKIHE